MSGNNLYLHVPDIVNFDVKYYINDIPDPCPKREYPMHIDDRLEIYILLEGDVSFVVESSLYSLSAGDAIVTKPNERHHCILNSMSPHRHICFWFDPSCEFIFSDFMAHEFGENNLIIPSATEKQRLLRIYDDLREAEIRKDACKKFCLTVEMLSIFRDFVRTDAQPQHLPPMLKTILGDIDQNFRTITTLNYFREKYYVSASTLNRLFRINLHTTPKVYIETKKLAHSRVLLKSGKSVLSACMESGFTDCANYIRLFRKRFGMTPGQYRADAPQSPTQYK